MSLPGRRKIGFGVLAALLLLVAAGCGRGKDLARLCVIHTNDVHGHVLPTQVPGERVGTGGLAVFSAWLEKVREENERAGIPTLLLDAGDVFTGTPEGALGNGVEIIALMNSLGYEAMAVGNHEFDFGYYNLTRIAEKAEFPLLGANIHTGLPGALDFVEPFAVFRKGDLQVGIIGLTTDEVPQITIAGSTGEIVFSPPSAAAASTLEVLRRQKPELVIALSHLGLEGDRELARSVPELDVIIGGHSHNLIPVPERAGPGKTIICQAGSYGRWAGKLDLWVERGSGKVERYEYAIFTNLHGAIPPHLETARALRQLEDGLDPALRGTYGISLTEITGSDRSESLLGNLIADAMREATGAEMSFQNPYGIRWQIFPGKITGRLLYLILPFGDTLVTMELSGAQIRALLEQSFSLHKGMLQVSGLKAEYDLSRPAGSRLGRVWAGEDELRDTRRYTVATNGFLAGGGDGFGVFTEGTGRRDTGIVLREAFGDYVRRHTPLNGSSFRPERLISLD